MARRVFEMAFQIGGNLKQSFSSAFQGAERGLSNLQDQSRQTQRALDQLGNNFRRGTITQSQYAESTERLTRELKQLELAQNRIQAFQHIGGNVRAVAGMAALGTAAIATTGAVSSVKKAMSFESQMSTIKALTGATSTEMKQMHDLSLKMGAQTKYSALEAGQGIEELLKAGITPAVVKAGALEAGLNLATAGGLELVEAAEVMSTALNSFKKDGMSAAEASNILAGTANASATGVHELKYSLSMAGSVANGVGLSFKDTNLALGVFANNGLKGSDAGTSLKTMLLNLDPSTKSATKLFKKLGVVTKEGSNEFYDAKGNIKSMAEVADVLQKSLSGLTNQERQSTLKGMFGTDAIRAANILYREGAKGVREFEQEMSKVTALDVAKEKMDNAAGAVEQMSGAFETMQIIAAEGTLPVVKEVALSLADSFEGAAPKVEKAGKRIGKSLQGITEPFTIKKPQFDRNRAKMDAGYIEEYQKEMAKYTKFNRMDFGDKVVYALDTTIDDVEKWVDGPGGDSFEKIFVKLAEISAKAYVGALGSLVKSSAGQIAEGNLASAGGLATIAYLMGGGAILKGGVGAAKWGVEKFKGMRGSSNSTSTIAAVNQQRVLANTTPRTTPGSLPPRATRIAQSSATRGINLTGNATKIISKAALPVTIALEGYNIYKADDKVKATAQAGGGLAGGWGGAAMGAAIGTAIAPGIGTAVGGVLGGIVGFTAGKFGAGKAVDAVRSGPRVETNSQSNLDTSGINTSTTNLKVAIDKNTFNFNILTSYTGLASGQVAGSFLSIKTSADRVIGNLDILTSYTGQASGWLASLNGIQNSAQKVITALEALESEIKSINLPKPKSRRLSFDD